jgi:hypothetical protein
MKQVLDAILVLFIADSAPDTGSWIIDDIQNNVEFVSSFLLYHC